VRCEGAEAHADPVVLPGQGEGAVPACQGLVRAAGGGIDIALELGERRVIGGDLQARVDCLGRFAVATSTQMGGREQPVAAGLAGSAGDLLLV